MHKESIYNKLTNFKNPITIEKFIELCLFDEEGYYLQSNVIGSSGDFITSPEISQLFGEIIGLYILDYWQINLKKKFNLIELGPGKGTLLFDMLRITKKFDHFNKSMEIKLIEKNKKLTDIQKINLRSPSLNINKIDWFHDFENNYKDPIIVIANEFFDCFPIKQFYQNNKLWYEKMIKYDPVNKYLKLMDYKINDSKTIENIENYKPSNVLEISKSREKYFSKICRNIKTLGGMILTIDYGYINKPENFTLQSLFNNKNSHILDNIGMQDITSLVDFNSLISIAKSYKLNIDVFSTQREFLIKNGIYERINNLLNNCKESQKNALNEGLNRIIDKNKMGTIFKVLVVSN